jgi:hypothetical protein
MASYRRVIRDFAFAVVLLGAAPAEVIADSGCAAAPSAYRFELPGQWTLSVDAGIASYRSRSTAEAVTVATYRIAGQRPDERQRLALLRRSAELGRALERERGGPRLELSPLVAERVGPALRVRYLGTDPDDGRRFVHLASSWTCFLQSVTYEAVATSPAAFAARVQAIQRNGGPAVVAARVPRVQTPAWLPVLPRPPGFPLSRE